MAKFEIYAGLGGGFGGAAYECTEEFETADAAMDFAYECAVEAYQRYEGMYGLKTFDELKQELENEYDDITDEDVEITYNEQLDKWLDYRVKEVTE